MLEAGSRWALVTGASSGLGVAFAEALAARKTNLVLTARREAPMRDLAARLTREHGVAIVVEAADLAASGSAAALQDRLDTQGITPDVLVNNAGFGLSGAFLGQDLDRLREMLQLDIVSLTELTHLFAKRMAARGRGHILLVASMASFQPCPHLAAYAAAKAYVLSLGESLNLELAPKVGVTVLSPGLMDTGFNEVSGFRPAASVRPTVLLPKQVAQIGLDALFQSRPSVVAGRLNRVMSFTNRFTSRRLQAKMALRMSEGS